MIFNNSRDEVAEIIREHGVYASATRGRSMRPLFKEGRDVVYVFALDTNIKKYDVLLYSVGNRLTLHRVIGFKEDLLLIRGDNTYELETVSREDVVGRLGAYTRRGKYKQVTSFHFKLFTFFAIAFYPVRYALRKIKHAVLGSSKKTGNGV